MGVGNASLAENAEIFRGGDKRTAMIVVGNILPP
jgi:hypothetical protein